MSKSNDSLPNVVIVGVGSAGARAAYGLVKKLDTTKFNLVVINPRPNFILFPSTARLVVSDRDQLKDKVLVPIESILHGKGRFVQGKVTKVEPRKEGGGSVILDNGETVSYRALILCPGVTWASPFDFPSNPNEVDAYLNSNHQAFERAKSIVLVGAGAVGCEVAGEIRDIWPDKKVTLVHGDNLPLNGSYPDKYRNAVRKSLETRQIDFLLNEYIDVIPGLEEEVTETTTRSGKTIKADLVISTRGQQPNTELFASSFGEDVLSPKKLVKVDPTLQLPGHQDIFVIGDVIDWNEQKQSLKAQAHADIAVANVLATLRGQAGNLKKYNGTPEMILLTNGKNGGVGFLPFFGGIVLGDWFARIIKSKSLMISKQREVVGVQ